MVSGETEGTVKSRQSLKIWGGMSLLSLPPWPRGEHIYLCRECIELSETGLSFNGSVLRFS